jgi:peptidoglycan hydrolase-like protein with peptidoglycan-binding domain
VPKRIAYEQIEERRGAGRLGAAIASHPREFVGILMAAIAGMSISANALFMQKGPHPAPIFATHVVQQQQAAKPQAVVPQTVPPPTAAVQPPTATNREQMIANIQRELFRRGFYDGAADGIWGAKTDAATRDFIQSAGVRLNAEPGELLLRAILSSGAKTSRPTEPVRNDPIAELIAPSKRVVAIQRALSDFGYGQLKSTGQYDPETKAAIEKFERDHRMPVTGQMSERLVRELAAMTGRLLE